MNIWLAATFILILALIPAIIITIRGEILDGVIGVQLSGMISTFAIITFGLWTEQSIYIDVAIIIAILMFCGGLAYAQFLERWL